MLARLSSKGQLVIPKAIREALGLQAGAQFYIQVDEGRIVLEPITVSPADGLYGKYMGEDFLTDLETEHHRELKDETPTRA